MDTNTIIAVAGIAWILGFWTFGDVIDEIVKIRKAARGEDVAEVKQATAKKTGIDWELVDKLEGQWKKLSKKDLKKITPFNEEGKIALKRVNNKSKTKKM